MQYLSSRFSILSRLIHRNSCSFPVTRVPMTNVRSFPSCPPNAFAFRLSCFPSPRQPVRCVFSALLATRPERPRGHADYATRLALSPRKVATRSQFGERRPPPNSRRGLGTGKGDRSIFFARADIQSPNAAFRSLPHPPPLSVQGILLDLVFSDPANCVSTRPASSESSERHQSRASGAMDPLEKRSPRPPAPPAYGFCNPAYPAPRSTGVRSTETDIVQRPVSQPTLFYSIPFAPHPRRGDPIQTPFPRSSHPSSHSFPPKGPPAAVERHVAA